MPIFTLKEDCWHKICNFLSAEDKVSLANTCQYLRQLIKTNLCLKSPIKVNEKLWHQIRKYERDVEKFFALISKNIEQLELNGLDNKQFEIAQKLHMPKIKSLSIKHMSTRSIENTPDKALLDIIQNTNSTLEELSMTDCLWRDLDTLRNYEFPQINSVKVLCKSDDLQNVTDYEILNRIFPGIEKLSIRAPISDRSLFYVGNLKELELTLDENTSVIKSFRGDPTLRRLCLRRLNILKEKIICEENRSFDLINFLVFLDSIEELQIDCHGIYCLSIFLLHSKGIKKIIFTYDNLFFCECGHDWLWGNISGINDFRCQVEGITLNSYLLRKCPDLNDFFRALLPILKRLTIFDKYSTDNNQVQADQSDLKPQLPENVDFKNTIEDLRAAILRFVHNSEILENLTVCANVCDFTFIKHVIEIVSSKPEHLKKPFTLCCHTKNITTKDLKELSIPDGFKIILKRKDYELPFIDSVEMEFTTYAYTKSDQNYITYLLLSSKF